MSDPLRLIVDLGNSALHWGLYRCGWDHLGHEPHAGGAQAAEHVCREVEALAGVPDVVAYCSVVPRAERAFARAVRERWGRLPVQYPAALPSGLEIRYDGPLSVGGDRLAAALAAWRLAPQGAVVVDCGTAVTVDAVSAEGVFLGGFIAPGVEAAASGLLERAALLHGPEGDLLEWLKAAPGGPGRTTEDCLRAGIGRGHAGLVERLIGEARAALPQGAAVIGTGRTMEPLRALGAPVDRVVPELVLDGVRLACDLVEPEGLLRLAAGRARELKHHLNKPTEEYDCEVVCWRPEHVVLRYVSGRDFAFAGVTIPRGSVTTAHYWPGRDYILWRLRGPGGEALGHLLHLIEGLQLAPGTVEYRDLVLDLWGPAGGEVRMLDEVELEAAVAAGRLEAERAERLRARARDLAAQMPALVAEAAESEQVET